MIGGDPGEIHLETVGIPALRTVMLMRQRRPTGPSSTFSASGRRSMRSLSVTVNHHSSSPATQASAWATIGRPSWSLAEASRTTPPETVVGTSHSSRPCASVAPAQIEP